MNRHLLSQIDAQASSHHEVAQFVRLSSGQMLMAMEEAGESLDDLTSSFIALIKDSEWLMKAIQEMQDSEHCSDMDPRIASTSSDVHRQIRSAVIAFQFFDKMTQRLDHVTTCLKGIEDIIEEHPDDGCTHQLLLNLDEKIQTLYSMESEKVLHSVLIDYHNLEQGLDEYHARLKDQDIRGHEGQIDLF